jgi:hypothetical protein
MMVAHLFTSITPSTLISISSTVGCTPINIYTSIDGCTPTSNMLSSFASFYIACASIDYYSTPSSSSNSSMYTRSIDVILGHACSLELQPLICLCKNSTIDVLILYIFWIIICAHCIFSMYDLLHILKMMVNIATTLPPMAKYSKLQHVLLFSTLLLFFFNSFFSSSYLCLCSLFCTSFSFATLYNFSIMFSTLMFLWIPELWKHTQLSARNENNFRRLFRLFLSLSFPLIPFIFWHACHLLINASSLKLW